MILYIFSLKLLPALSPYNQNNSIKANKVKYTIKAVQIKNPEFTNKLTWLKNSLFITVMLIKTMIKEYKIVKKESNFPNPEIKLSTSHATQRTKIKKMYCLRLANKFRFLNNHVYNKASSRL